MEGLLFLLIGFMVSRVKKLQPNDSFPLLQNKKSGAISSGKVSDYIRMTGIIAGVLFLILFILFLMGSFSLLFLSVPELM